MASFARWTGSNLGCLSHTGHPTLPVLAKLVEMRAISIRLAGAPRAKTKPNVRCPRVVPLHTLQPGPEPRGDIFSDRSTRVEETHFRVESKECSRGQGR